jgi:hypothetical protein
MKTRRPSIETWVVGVALFIFFVCVFVFGPESLPEFKQRMLAFASAFLAGIFAFLFTGDLTVQFELKSSPLGKMLAKGTGGAAVFVLVLWWWFSSLAPVTPKAGEVTATVQYVLSLPPQGGEPLLPLPKDMFASGTKLSIVGRPHGQNWPPRAWFINWQEGSSEIDISSNRITGRDDPRPVPTEAGPVLVSVRTYGGFTGVRGAFGSPTTWKKTALSAIIVSDRTKEVDDWLYKLSLITGRNPNDSKDRFFNFYGKDSAKIEEFDVSVTPSPFAADLCIYLDGELVASLAGRVARVKRYDEDVRVPYITVFRTDALARC